MKLLYIAVLTAYLFSLTVPEVLGRVVINEVMSSNGSTIQDEDGDYPDWIELYNKGDMPYDLTGYKLTDDPLELKWEFPPVVLAPGEHLLVFASNKDRYLNELHTNFAISKAGEPLYLINTGNFIADELEPVHIPRDKSYGRKPDGSENLVYFQEPTPGYSNITQGFSSKLEEPEFSRPGGFYSNSFKLDLSASDEDAVIYFTLDGSEPDSTALKYDGPIKISNRADEPNVISEIRTSHPDMWLEPRGKINKNTVVRAMAYKEGALPSDAATNTYFIEKEGAERYSIPVISISTDKDHLFDYDTGIYVPGRIMDEKYDPEQSIGHLEANYNQRGREWERPAYIEMYDREGRRVLSQDAGLRIHGSYSRAYPRKSLRLYARRDYGLRYFDHPLFEDKPYIHRSRRFILRNSGQDRRETQFRDAFIQSLFENMDVAGQGTTPAIVFINGEYWGIHNIRERIDQWFLKSNKGVDPDKVDLLENKHGIKEGDNTHYKQMLEYIDNNDLTNDETYEGLKTFMDVDNFIEHNISHIYASNYDWPGNNIDFWRSGLPDSRWRWINFDFDFGFEGFAGGDGVEYDMIAHTTKEGHDDWPNPDWSTKLLVNLLKNEQFKHQFINRFADLLNTEFQPERVIRRLEAFSDIYEPEIEEHIHRWDAPADKNNWRWHISLMRSFAFERPFFVRRHIQKNFQLEGTYELILEADNPELGYISVNTIDVNELKGGWSGKYFKGVPVTVTAVPYEGARFVEWEADTQANVSHLVLNPDGNFMLRARFEEDPEFEPPYTNPEPHVLRNNNFRFNYWGAYAEEGTYPDNMALHQMGEKDPGLSAHVLSDWMLPYDRESRSRIVGLNEEGIGFINTTNPQEEPGSGYAGAAVLALDTRDRGNIKVSWTGRTIMPNSRHYAIRLQYRRGIHEGFRDVKDEAGRAVEYVRDPVNAGEKHFKEIKLPESLEDETYVQLRWRYYYLGGESGPRGFLGIDNIHVTSDSYKEKEIEYSINPNPNKGLFYVQLGEPLPSDGTLRLYTMTGKKVFEKGLDRGTINTGMISIKHLPQGHYIMHIQSGSTNIRSRLVFRGP